MVSHRMSLIRAGRVSLLEGNEPVVTHTCWHGSGSCVYRIIRRMITDRMVCSFVFGQKRCTNADVNA